VAQGSFSFEIQTPEELLATLKEDFAELQANPKSSRYAIHCAFLGWHLHEWVWGKKFKSDWAARKRAFTPVPRGKDDFVAAVRNECSDLEIMQGVAEGSKHLGTTAAVAGTVDDLHNAMPGRAMFGHMMLGSAGVLGVQMSDGKVVEFLPAVQRVVAYWEKIVSA
jgi:hypothetical protein